MREVNLEVIEAVLVLMRRPNGLGSCGNEKKGMDVQTLEGRAEIIRAWIEEMTEKMQAEENKV